KRPEKLIFWESFEEAQKAADEATKLRKRPVEVVTIGFTKKQSMERFVTFEEKYSPCLQGYILKN
ncbi:MAG: hypothetical protein ACRCWR_00765, partial [Saezia sp.]